MTMRTEKQTTDHVREQLSSYPCAAVPLCPALGFQSSPNRAPRSGGLGFM